MSPFTKPKRFLVVDDHDMWRDLFARAIERAGFHVVTATNGEEALRLVHADPPDAIWTDIHMPRMDGIHLARAIRNHGLNLPIVIASSNLENSGYLLEDILAISPFTFAKTVSPTTVATIQALAKRAIGL